jgi:hypothetical protein
MSFDPPMPAATNYLPSPANTRLPLRTSRVLTTLLVLPAALVLLSPFGLVAVAAAAQPEMLNVLADKPLAAAQLTGGLLISLLFCLLPFSRWAALPLRPAESAARQERAHPTAAE